MKTAISVLAVVVLIALAGCGGGGKTDNQARFQVFVGIPPVKYIVDQIGGDLVNVQVLNAEGKDPHTFEPTPSQISALSQTQLYISIGMPFENEIVKKLKAANPQLNIIQADLGIEKRLHAEASLDGHPASYHTDPHLWLSPFVLESISNMVCLQLTNYDKNNAIVYSHRWQSFVDRLQETHRNLRTRLEPFRGRTFYVFHPSFGYFAEVFGLKQIAIEVDGKQPSPRQVAKMVDLAKSQKVKIIFTQPQFSSRSAELIAKHVGASLESINPLSYDILKNYETIARALEKSFQ
ncbi:metal ABC transporter solute-binding protein, Zn/Mn family [Calditrichota bacterium]